MLEVTSGSGNFLTAIQGFLSTALEMGTSIFTWCISTEPINYFLGLGLIAAVVGLVYKIKRG